jgi:hypothetical protein
MEVSSARDLSHGPLDGLSRSRPSLHSLRYRNRALVHLVEPDLRPKVSHASPGHVKRRSLPLLRQLAALRRRNRECGGHGQEGPLLPLVGDTQ